MIMWAARKQRASVMAVAAMEPVMGPSMEVFMPEMVETMAEEDESSGEEGRTIAPRIHPIVLAGIRGDVDHLRRQRVDLERQSGRVLGDSPEAVRLLTHLSDRLPLLSVDHHRHGEVAADG
jgi:hypothetical protein